VFDADNLVELCQKHVATPPLPPSERGIAIPAVLENALLACLEKSRAKRPQTARDLSLLISRCPEAMQWSIEDSDAWWGRHERGHASGVRPFSTPEGAAASRANELTIDLTVKRQ
jgi:hypothetical protein